MIVNTEDVALPLLVQTITYSHHYWSAQMSVNLVFIFSLQDISVSHDECG